MARGGDEYKKVAQLAELLLGQEGVVSRECPGFEPSTSLVLLAKLDSDDDPARHLCKMRHTGPHEFPELPQFRVQIVSLIDLIFKHYYHILGPKIERGFDKDVYN